MNHKELEQPVQKREKEIVSLDHGQYLEIKYDPKTRQAIEAIRRDEQGRILEYTNLKELKKQEEKLLMLKAMGLKKPEKYASFIE